MSSWGNSISQAAGVMRYVWDHPANQGRRASALIRAAAFQVRGRLGRRTIVTIGESTRMWAVLHRTASSKVVYGNPPDFPEMTAWRKLLKPGDLFVDVGSNVGTYTLWAVDCGASAIAVEPASDTAALLCDNLVLNGHPPVEVFRGALAAEPGEMWLSIGQDATNRLIVDGDSGERVQVTTLDTLLGERTAAGVKIDVEGAEHMVLQGASRALSEGRVRVFQLEWNGMSRTTLGEDRWPIVNLLADHGYKFCRPDPNGNLVPTDDLDYGDDIFAVR